MKIALVTEVWLPSVNGMVTRLTATVDELIRTGHEVLVIAPTSESDNFHGAAVRTVPALRSEALYGGQPWGLPAPRVGRYIAEFDPHLVHVANPAWLGMAGVAAARLQRRPLVCSYHTDVASYAEYYGLGWAPPVIWSLLRLIHGRADVNLVTSHAAGRQLADHQIPRLAHWTRGVDLDAFRSDASHETHATPGAIEALYVGRVAAEKNLAALEPLARTPGMHLTIVGDGPYRGELTNLLAGADVTFTGELHGAQLAAAYAAADVFVFPSTTDTLGLVLLEASAAGLPIVAAHSPASQEILATCPAARLCPPQTLDQLPALVRELLASAPPPALAAAARQRVAGDTWATATAGLVEHYRQAIYAYGSRRPRPSARPRPRSRRSPRLTRAQMETTY